MVEPKIQNASPVGENKTRIDAREKVTGAAIFADDIQFGNALLHARIKRSPHPHALIKKIDVTKARALPGVKALVTGEAYPALIGLYLKDRHIFCRDRVRYVGDPFAGVAATSEEIAEQARSPSWPWRWPSRPRSRCSRTARRSATTAPW